jgi:hypothetical protein
MPEPWLDHQAAALRVRLASAKSYPDRARDSAELRTVEGELARRTAATRAEVQQAHGGVMLCKRTADLPVIGSLGLTHWWLETAHKSVGMGQADGTVPGHGEVGPSNRATRLVDHSSEPRTDCTGLAGVDEDCVDRELQVGTDTGEWTPGFNDCHTVVTTVVDKCRGESIAKALATEDDAKRGDRAR